MSFLRLPLVLTYVTTDLSSNLLSPFSLLQSHIVYLGTCGSLAKSYSTPWTAACQASLFLTTSC